MLDMGLNDERKMLEKYFYSGNNTGVLILIAILTSMTVIIPIIILIVLLVRFFKSSNKDAELMYDECVVEDIEYLKTRAIEVMGVIEDELSLIEPIVGSSFANSDCVHHGIEIKGKQASFLKETVQGIFSVPIAIWNFIKSLFRKEDKVSEQIFIEGSDNIVRSSLRRVSFIAFTEEQIIAYECCYDIALGRILDEITREIFYRDVDAVTYGDYLLHVWSWKNKKTIRTVVSKLALVVPSRDNIYTELAGDAGVIEEQAIAVRALVRSKKQEMA